MRIIPVLLIALAVAFAGCAKKTDTGGGDNSTTSTPGTTPSTTSTSPSTSPTTPPATNTTTTPTPGPADGGRLQRRVRGQRRRQRDGHAECDVTPAADSIEMKPQP